MEQFIIRKSTRNIKLKNKDTLDKKQASSFMNKILSEDEYNSENEETQEPIYVILTGHVLTMEKNAKAGFGVYLEKMMKET